MSEWKCKKCGKEPLEFLFECKKEEYNEAFNKKELEDVLICMECWEEAAKFFKEDSSGAVYIKHEG